MVTAVVYFNVSQLLKEPGGSTRRYEVDDEVGSRQEGLARQVRGVVEMLRTDSGVWVSAALETFLPSVCSRCIEGFDQPVRMKVEEEYIPTADAVTGGRLIHGSEFDENFRIDEGHVLDLSEAVRQYAEMSAPMKPVCRTECAGMCLVCGTNLNEAACGCNQQPVDPRWAALQGLALPGERESQEAL